MPIYEYRPKSGECGKCGGHFTDLQKISDPAHLECPRCGKPCEKIISIPLPPSVRGADYRANDQARQAAESKAIAPPEAGLASASEQSTSHSHDCSIHGCYAEKKDSPI